MHPLIKTAKICSEVEEFGGKFLPDVGGWVAIIDMPSQSQYDFKNARLTNYITLLDFTQWRTLKPELVFEQIDDIIIKRLNG